MRTLQRAPRLGLLLWLSCSFSILAACSDDDGGDDDKADSADEAGEGDGNPGDDDGDDDGFDDGDDDWGDGDGDGDPPGDGDGDPPGDGDGDPPGDGDGDSSGPIECCSLFDCPGTEVMCDCGAVSGCFITGDECGHCITEADCEAYCANSAPPAPFTMMVAQ